MTARDAARSRHPSSGGPGSPRGATGRRLPPHGPAAASTITLLLVVFATLAPTVAGWLALGVLAYLVLLVGPLAAIRVVCGLFRARRSHQLDRHIEQALRVVE